MAAQLGNTKIKIRVGDMPIKSKNDGATLT